ncbi:MAG TPA: hypothetical protein VF996_03135 [Candidatus Saccharimonadales bacterium]
MTIEVREPSPPQSEFTHGSESLDRMQEGINQKADKFENNHGDLDIGYGGRARLAPEGNMFSSSEQESVEPEDKSGQIEDADTLRGEVRQRDDLRNLKEQGRYGVQHEGTPRSSQEDFVRNSGLTPEEIKLISGTVREKTAEKKQEHMNDRAHMIPKSERRGTGIIDPAELVSSREAGQLDVDRGEKADKEYRRILIEQKRHDGASEHYKESIQKIRTTAHSLFERNPEKYSGISVQEFVEEFDDYSEHMERAERTERLFSSLESAQEYLEAIDINESVRSSDLEKAVNEALYHIIGREDRALAISGYPVQKTTGHRGEFDRHVLELMSDEERTAALGKIGNLFFGGTDIQKVQNGFGEAVSDRVSDRVSYSRDNQPLLEVLTEATVRADEVYGVRATPVFDLSPDKTPIQVFSEFKARLAHEVDQARREVANLTDSANEAWGRAPDQESQEVSQ